MTTSYNTTGPNGGCGCAQGFASFTQPELSDALMRPRFFPGQLLTEDDLGQLVSYVTAKSRLHNRFLFGAGVVAGLQVRKHPASPRAVRVDAGYALDPHGHDIVVPCRQDLDLLAMVRELVRARMGKDCDPVSNPPEQLEGTPTPKPLRQYGLYLRYHEQPTEPVAPYTTGDDPCAEQACQFSRVQEGFVFELRCFEPLARHGLQEALQCCLESKRPRALWPKDLELLKRRVRELRKALDQLSPEPVSGGGEEPARGVYTLSREDIASARALLKVGPLMDAPLEDKAEQLERAASLVARYDLSDKPEEARESFEELRGLIHGDGGPGLAQEVLDGARRAELSPLERKTVTTIATESRQLTGSERTEDWGSLRHRMLAAGAALDDALRAEYQAAVDTALKRPALDTSSSRPSAASPQRAPPEEELRRTVAQLERLSEQDEATLRECLCEVLSPPYRHPEDPAVLLARVDVRDCDVVEICNMARQIVLSPAAVQYWVGGALHEQFEQYCCAPRWTPPEERYSRERLRSATKGADLRAGGREVLSALLRMAGPTAAPRTRGAGALRQSEAERPGMEVTEPEAPSAPELTPEPPRPAEPPPSEATEEKAPRATTRPQEPGTSRGGRGGTRRGGRRG